VTGKLAPGPKFPGPAAVYDERGHQPQSQSEASFSTGTTPARFSGSKIQASVLYVRNRQTRDAFGNLRVLENSAQVDRKASRF